MKNAMELVADLVESLRTSGPVATTTGGPTTLPDLGRPVDLSAVEAVPRRDVLDTLTARRSRLTFSRDPLPYDDVLAEVLAGLGFDEASRGTTAVEVPLEAFVFLRHPTLESVEVFSVRTTGVRSLGLRLSRSQMEDLGVQREFGNAAAIVTFAADLDQAHVRQGVRGYQLLMVRAASATYRVSLAAVSRGWICSVFAGLIPGAVRSLLESDGTSRHQLFAVAIGTERG